MNATARRALRTFLWRYAKADRPAFLRSFFVSLGVFGLSIGIPFLFHRAVNSSLLEKQGFLELLRWTGLAFLAIVLRAILEMTQEAIMTGVWVRRAGDLRLALFRDLRRMDFEWVNARHSGEIGQLFAADAQHAASVSLNIFYVVWHYPALLLGITGVMVYFEPTVALVAVLGFPLLGLFTLLFGEQVRKAKGQYLGLQGESIGYLMDWLRGLKQKSLPEKLDSEEQRLKGYDAQIAAYARKSVLAETALSSLSEVLNSVFLIAAIFFGYFRVSQGGIEVSNVVGCLLAAFMMRSPARCFVSNFAGLQRSIAALERLEHVRTSARAEIPAAAERDFALHSLALENVSFSHDGHRNVLSGASIELRAGEIVGIGGSSGAGKSTLVDVLTGLYPVSGGRVTVNGRPLQEISLQSWRRRVGLVAQEAYLFSATIRENVDPARSYAEQDFEMAVRLTGLEKIAANLPRGLDTPVGEAGGFLSGGERKRIAIARALVRRPQLLIFDEATSDLDADSVQAILGGIHREFRDALILHVSHTPSVLALCRRRLILEKGQIEEVSHARSA